jgi:hypothetical protein
VEEEEELAESVAGRRRLALTFEIHDATAGSKRRVSGRHRDCCGFDVLGWLPLQLDELDAHVVQVGRF